MKQTATVRLRRAVGLAVATTMAAAALVATTSPAEAASAPKGFKAARVASKGVGLSWNKTGQDAYRLRFSTSSNMTSNADTWDVLGTYYEWTRYDANPNRLAPRLKPGHTYWFQVKSISNNRSADDRRDLSKYTRPLKVRLPSKGSSELKPVNLKVTAASAVSTYVSWRSRGPGVSYIVRYTDRPKLSVSKWNSMTTDVAGGIVPGLKPATKYTYRVRVVSRTGKALSSYSSSLASTTRVPATPRLRLADYNVHKASGEPGWGVRREAVAANILARQPDIVTLQEASPLLYEGVKQYDDLLGLLGTNYDFATRDGSSGSKLVYNTTRLTVVTSGSRALTTVGTATRYAVWAVFEDRLSGGRFFVVNTHLEPGSPETGSYNDARIQQAKEVLALVGEQSGGLPVVIAGDMNSSRTADPDNGQYLTFTGAGYTDPLANDEATWATGRGATAEHMVDKEFNSFNGYEPAARRTSFPVGSFIDYVYTSPGVRVAMWRTVVDLDTAGNFVGAIPSDHNLVTVDLHVPAAATPAG